MAKAREQARETHPGARTRAAAKSSRLAARISAEQKMILARAAALNHQPVSQFVISSAMRAAEETIREQQIIALSARDSLAVMEALLDPAPAGPGLRRVAERYNAFMQQ